MNFLSVFNPFGIAFAAALLVPYIVYRRSHPYEGAGCPNRGMVYVAKIGMYVSLFLMCFHLGVLEQGFTNPKELMSLFWLISTSALTSGYWLSWALLIKRGGKSLASLTVVLIAVIVIYTGLLQVNTLLFTFGFIYLIGELYLIRKTN